MRQFFKQPGMAEVNALRNGTLQGAYLIIGARALGLDCGPMSGLIMRVSMQHSFQARQYSRTLSAVSDMGNRHTLPA